MASLANGKRSSTRGPLARSLAGLLLGGLAWAASLEASAQGVPSRLPAPAALTEPTVAAVVNQVLQALDRVSIGGFAIEGESTRSGGLSLSRLNASVRFRFSRNLSISLQAPTGNPQLDSVIPVVLVGLAGVEGTVEAASADGGATGVARVRLSKPGTTDGATAAVRSQNMDLIALQFRGIDIQAAGFAPGSGRFEIRSENCDLLVRTVNWQTGQAAMQPTLCQFSGFYEKNGSDYGVRFNLDTSAPAARPR